MSRIGTSVKTKSGGQELGEGAVGHFLGMRFLFGGNENVLELDGGNDCTSLC